MIETDRFELSKEQYVRVVSEQIRRRYRWIYWPWLTISVALVLFVALGAALGVAGVVRYWGPFALIVLGGLWGTFHLQVHIRARSPLEKQNLRTYWYTLDDSMFVVRSETGYQCQYPISAIPRVTRGSDHYLVFTTSQTGEIVPFSAFRSEADRAEFEQRFAPVLR